MQVYAGLVALALASAISAAPIAPRDAVQDVGNGLKAGADALGLTAAHNSADKIAQGSIKQFEDESGLTQAAEGVGLVPFGEPLTKRDAVQDVGNGLKAGADALGLTAAHNSADKIVQGSIKKFEDDSGLTQAAEGVGIVPFGQPVTKLNAVQEVGNAVKAGADALGLTAAHNSADKVVQGSIKKFEDDSGLTQAAEGVGFVPFGEPLTKRDAVQDVGNGLKAGADALGLTAAHNSADKIAQGSIKQFEDESGLTQAAEGVGLVPFGEPLTKRDA